MSSDFDLILLECRDDLPPRSGLLDFACLCVFLFTSSVSRNLKLFDFLAS